VDDARHQRLELFATVLLAVAAVATAWSTYQSAQWRGEQALDASKATAARIQSSEASTRAGQLTQIDIATFIQWINAGAADRRPLARFYRERFRDEFRPAFAAWIATRPFTNRAAPPSPFAMPQYRVAEAVQSANLNTAAGRYADDAGEANQRADDYMLAVVLFASSLFFAGISTKLRTGRQREAILALGYLIFIGTVVWIATLPLAISI
jgi:hypothetical protein